MTKTNTNPTAPSSTASELTLNPAYKKAIGLGLWNAIRTVEPEFLKTSEKYPGKNLHAINPMSGYQYMTRIFGPCGTGWGYATKEIHPKGDFIFVRVELWYRPVCFNPAYAEEDCCRIEGWGGRRLADGGDDTMKMAETDALSRCFRALGHGADIYAGLMDDNKFASNPASASAGNKPSNPPTAAQDPAEEQKSLEPSGHEEEAAEVDRVAQFVHELREQTPLLSACEAKVLGNQIYFVSQKGMEYDSELVSLGFNTPSNKPEILCKIFNLPTSCSPDMMQ